MRDEHAGKLAVLLATAEGGYSGRDVDPGRTGAARRTTEEAGRGPPQDRSPHPDRSPRRRALDPRAGGARGQSRGARGHGEGARQEAWRQAAGAAGRGARTRRPDQSDRRGLPHHAGGGRWLRAILQRASRGDGGPPVGGRHRCRASRQRRAARTSSKPSDAGQAGGGAGGSGPAADDARRQWPFQRGQCGGLRCGRDRAAARARPYPHHPSLDRRFAAAPPAPTNPTPLAAMVHRLATPHGKKLYARRKHTPEPGFGIIKSVLGFRQFLLRGLDKVRGEWSLVTMACNMKRILALATRPREHWAIVTQPPPGQPATLRQVSNRFSLALSTQLGVPSLDQLNSSPTGC